MKKDTFEDNEDGINEKTYSIELTHLQIRSLVEWIPKNYESEPHEEGGILKQIFLDAEELSQD